MHSIALHPRQPRIMNIQLTSVRIHSPTKLTRYLRLCIIFLGHNITIRNLSTFKLPDRQLRKSNRWRKLRHCAKIRKEIESGDVSFPFVPIWRPEDRPEAYFFPRSTNRRLETLQEAPNTSSTPAETLQDSFDKNPDSNPNCTPNTFAGERRKDVNLRAGEEMGKGENCDDHGRSDDS